MSVRYPERIVCLTEETTETLYLLGEDRRIVGISGFTVRPPQARREKPRVSAFTSAKIDRIIDLAPDLVLGFSDLQADIAADLIRRGIAVHVFNHRSIEEILTMVAVVGGLVGQQAKALSLCASLRANLAAAQQRAESMPVRPRVYFEEWDEPQISGIRWVSELLAMAGGDDCFPELAKESLGKNRIIADPLEVVRRQPDIIIASWCGKKFRAERVIERPGWAQVAAVRDGELHEIKSSLILQPGPAALSDGLAEMSRIVQAWSAKRAARV